MLTRFSPFYIILPDVKTLSPHETKAFLTQLEILRHQRQGYLFQLRFKHEASPLLHNFILECLTILKQAHNTIFINFDMSRQPATIEDLAHLNHLLQYNIDGIHFPSRFLTEQKRDLTQQLTQKLIHTHLIAFSCHHGTDIKHAQKLNAHFVTLSPIESTKSHPGEPTLGWEKASFICRKFKPLPVFALGGLAPSDLREARQHGAFGIAGISAFWENATHTKS